MEKNKRLKFIIEESGISAYRIAKTLGISHSTISGYVNEKNEVPNLFVWSVAYHFRFNPEYILFGKMPMYLDDDDFPVIRGEALELDLIGSSSAGTPTETWEREGKIIIPSAFFEGNAVVVQGSSMEKQGFFDGDVAILDNDPAACESKKNLAYSTVSEPEIVRIKKCYILGRNKAIKYELWDDQNSSVHFPEELIIHGIAIGLLRKL